MGKLRVFRKGVWQYVDVVDEDVPGGGAFSGDLSDLTIDVAKDWGGYKITNLADPASAQDADTKGARDTALALKANLASPTLTGIPAAPTAAPGTNTTQLATTAFVLANSIDHLVEDLSPQLGGDLDTNDKLINFYLSAALKGWIVGGTYGVVINANTALNIALRLPGATPNPYTGAYIGMVGDIDMTYHQIRFASQIDIYNGITLKGYLYGSTVALDLISNTDQHIEFLTAGTGKIYFNADYLPLATNTSDLGDATHIVAEGHFGLVKAYSGTTLKGSIYGISTGLEIDVVGNLLLAASGYIDVVLSEVKNAADPTAAQSLATKAYVDAGAQSDVTASRLIDVSGNHIYQNTSGRRRLVSVSITSGQANQSIVAMCDSGSTPTTYVAYTFVETNGVPGLLSFVVPNNYYYRVVTSGAGGGTVSVWIEWGI